uniref:Oligopeptide ABC transporter n=1 Tax=bacterium AK-MB16 TaxID=1136496 RepID=B2G4X3_UNCXX|nr:oligopeptide ABC transporter [bacterium AK-MB16]
MILVGAFDLGPGGNPQKFNPLAASAGFTWYNKYFGTLALYDVGFEKISGDLAESWTMAPDGRLITFKLRKGVKWHDGKPFSAKDVKFTLELAKNPDSGSLFVARLTA